MTIFALLALFLGAVCFLAAAVNVTARRVNLTAAGLFCWIMVALVAHLNTLI